jgi:hypothetical protein
MFDINERRNEKNRDSRQVFPQSGCRIQNDNRENEVITDINTEMKQYTEK